MKLRGGNLQIGRYQGAPVLLHWSLPVGMLLFTRLRFAPAAWVAFLLLILIHELGHAAMVQRFRFKVLTVEVMGYGGLCRWTGRANALQDAWIASGGVLAQAALLLGAVLFQAIAGAPASTWGAEVTYVFIWTNLWVIGFNLLPIEPLDGARAWALPRLLWARRRKPPHRPASARRSPPRPRQAPPPLEPPEGEADPALMAEIDQILQDARLAAKRRPLPPDKEP